MRTHVCRFNVSMCGYWANKVGLSAGFTPQWKIPLWLNTQPVTPAPPTWLRVRGCCHTLWVRYTAYGPTDSTVFTQCKDGPAVRLPEGMFVFIHRRYKFLAPTWTFYQPVSCLGKVRGPSDSVRRKTQTRQIVCHNVPLESITAVRKLLYSSFHLLPLCYSTKS